MQYEKGKTYTLNEVSLEDHWNSYGIRQIRKKMLNGEKVKVCGHCYYQESIGMASYRQRFNKEWLSPLDKREDILNRVRKSRTNGYRVEEPPIYLDIRPGNLCNLKCRMCCPSSSSKIYQEQQEILKENRKEFTPLINTDDFQQDEKSFNSWYKNSKIWKSIYKWSKGVQKIYFTGGEPTLIKENWDLIEYLTNKGYSKNIDLLFNINCTYAPSKLLDTFNNFLSIHINFSVDGFKEIQEYIRYPSNWKVTESNIIKILKHRRNNTSFYFTPVVQIYNVLDLHKLLVYINKLSQKYGIINIDIMMCIGHNFLKIESLPKTIKKKALQRIESYEDS